MDTQALLWARMRVALFLAELAQQMREDARVAVAAARRLEQGR
jgi:hypothetical protein